MWTGRKNCTVGLGAVREEAKAQKEVVKAELKEELTKELVTKADLEVAVANLKAEIEGRFGEIEARFVRLEICLKVLAGIMLAGFTIFNPGFHKVVKIIIASIGA